MTIKKESYGLLKAQIEGTEISSFVNNDMGCALNKMLKRIVSPTPQNRVLWVIICQHLVFQVMPGTSSEHSFQSVSLRIINK